LVINLSFEQLVDICSRGIVQKKHSLSPVKTAIDNGTYFGCPGKEIYYAISWMDESQIKKLASIVCLSFPKESPGRSIHLSVFLRYIYGCFDKQGCLHGPKQAQKMKSEKRDWSKSDKFVDYMITCFKNRGNLYGEMMCYEMKAHRLGDMIIIHNDLKYLDSMINFYKMSAILAEKVNAKKNTFSAYYWAMRYLYELKRPKSEILHYAKLFFDKVEKYCNTSTAKGKVTSAFNIVHRICSKRDWRVFRKHFATYKNPVIKDLNQYTKREGNYNLKFAE